MDGQLTRIPNELDYPFDDESMLYHNSQLLRTMSDRMMKGIKSGTKRIEDFHKELERISVADARSLLYTYNILSGKSWENINYDDDDYKNLLIKELKKWSLPIDKFNELIDAKLVCTLPKIYLDWFKSDLRCSLFLMSLIHNMVSHGAYKGKDELIVKITSFLLYNIVGFNSHVSNNLGYKETINVSGDWRIANLQSIKSTYLKGRTEDKEIRWLDVKNHDQVEWAYSYLDKGQDKRILLHGIFFPETIEEKYELILAHLDRLSNIESYEVGTKNKKGFSPRSYTLSSMKKAWRTQKQYQSNSNANDGNITVYIKNQAKLKALMAFSGFTANQIINKYIEDTHKNMLSLDSQNEEQAFEYTKYDKDDEKNVDIPLKEEVLPDSNSIKPASEITSSIDKKKKSQSMSVTIRRKKIFDKPPY